MGTVDAQDQEGADEEAGAFEEPAGETMESLLAQQAAVTQKLAEKQVAWVKVIQVTKSQVLVDIGEKREGVIGLSEFTGDLSDPKKPPQGKPPVVGQRIPVLLMGGGRDGVPVLSYKKAKAEIGWQAAAKAFAEKARVRGRVVSAIKGGFLVDVGGVSAFLPASLADLRPVRAPARLVGSGVRCTIIELNEAKKQLVLSRKAVLEEEAAKRREKILLELRVGEIRIGRVVQASPAGLTVDIGGLEGFVRTADVAWGAPKAPVSARGAKVRVKVLAKPEAPEKEEEKVLLGIKQLMPNPADAIRKKFPPKSVVQGKVVEAGAAGVRIAIDDRHFALSPKHECDAEAVYKPGLPVSAIVTGVDLNTFDLIVSINKFDEIRDRKKIAQYLKPPRPLTLGQLLSPEQGE